MKYIWGFLESLIYINGTGDENGLLDMFIESLTENVKSFLCNLGKYQWVWITSRLPPLPTANSLDFSPKDAIHLKHG